jgi:ABC-type multidrug transport system fused ATPase/permease subunit
MRAVQACALEEDIAALPGGDQTEIGERGINLSGGQKARVSLGRACYADTDIVILDDILSAVDAHVARTITDKCLVALLRNRGKTVLLATHQTLCFPEADHLLMLKDGQIAFAGTFAEAQLSPEFTDMLGKSSEEKTAKKAVYAEGASADGAGAAAAPCHTPSAKATAEKSDDAKKKEEGQLIKKEDAAKGAVTTGVYLAYIKMIGNTLFVLVVLLAMMLNAQQILVNWWLSRWSVASEDPENARSVHYYLWIYFALGMGACSLILSYQLVSAYGGLRAAARIHAQMFQALLFAPMSFYDTTPSGRLLNLFAADIKAIDETLISQLNGSLSLIFMMLAVIGTVVSVVPLMVVPLIPLFWFYGWLQWIYRNTARELKRFDSTTQSPVFNHFAESLNGLATIRAFRCEPRMLQETQRRVDANSRFWTKNNFVNRWLGLRLDWIGASLVGCTALACVLAIRFDLIALDPGLVGLVLSYTATLTGLLNWGVRRFSEAELGMVAVERTRKLFSCPQEETASAAAALLTDALLPASWPTSGEVRLTNVTARYRPGLPPVLRDVSVHIPSHSKVGVCGRTGSGKTTLAKCLFRLMEVEGGKIEIDGVDIARVRLADLRSKITMIPQDPTLFAGPLRYRYMRTNFNRCMASVTSSKALSFP